MKRRKFVNHMGFGVAATVVPQTLISFKPNRDKKIAKPLKFGIVSDVHKDLIPDADERLEKFIATATAQKVDFIIQLGDFCFADSKNLDFLGIWESFQGPKFHVLGNHDMDKNSKSEMLEFWGMPKTYYSYDFNGVHFIVLDANFLYQEGKFVDYERANFYVNDNERTYINDEQIAWFKDDLEATKLPTIVFSHQSLWHYQWGIKNRLTIQKILEANESKIICCMNGHNHLDFHHQQNGIDYIEVNSMSYQWMSEPYTSADRFPKHYYKEYGNLPHIAAYKDPLYAVATIDPKGTMQIEGVKSEWLAPSPYDMGMPKGIYGSEFTAEMSSYKLKF